MLGWRLIGDMQPLRFQVMVVVNFARQWRARAAGLPLSADIGSGLDLAGFQAAIAEARAHPGALAPRQFDGGDEIPITVSIGDGSMKPSLPAGQWLAVFATTNILFHLSTVYGILRAHGVPIGKINLFAAGI